MKKSAKFSRKNIKQKQKQNKNWNIYHAIYLTWLEDIPLFHYLKLWTLFEIRYFTHNSNHCLVLNMALKQFFALFKISDLLLYSVVRFTSLRLCFLSYLTTPEHQEWYDR